MFVFSSHFRYPKAGLTNLFMHKSNLQCAGNRLLFIELVVFFSSGKLLSKQFQCFLRKIM